MRNSGLIFLLVILIAIGFYFLGKKSGSSDTKTEIVQNYGIVKQIAELASLQVSGTTQLKISNNSGDGSWEKFKSYFTGNTLLLALPFDARYGVDMSKQAMKVDTRAGTVEVFLPKCTLLSVQLRLDRLETMSQTGIFATASIADFVKAQKQLYKEATLSLENNQGYIKLAQENICGVLNNYYSPLGYKVTCIFGKEANVLLQ